MSSIRGFARALALALAAVSVQPFAATTLTVSNINDTGPGALRSALAFAVSGDTIEFAPGVTGTIALGSTLTFTQSVNLNGPGAGSLVLDGQGTVRVIDIAAGTAPVLSGLTIANGNADADAGGGVRNAGTLTVTDSIFTGNAAEIGGAIINAPGAALAMERCTFQNNTSTFAGGAILTFGAVTVSDSTFSGNGAVRDGGVFDVQSSATAAVINSTFFGNHAGIAGGAIVAFGPVSIINSTLAGNTADSGAAIYAQSASLILHNNVITDNASTSTAGAVYRTGTAAFAASNDVFYNNTAAGIEDDQAGYGASNFIVATAQPLGPLRDNGGPTQTMAPVFGGVAICAASAALLPGGVSEDQRGLPRKNGSCLDAGSVQSDVIFNNGFEGG